MKLTLCFFILCLTHNSYAKNYALIFGGNCEEQSVDSSEDEYSSENKFLPEMIDMTAGLTLRGWDTKVNYDGRFARCSVKYKKCKDKDSKSCCPKGINPSRWSKKRLKAMSGKDVGYGSKEDLIASLRSIRKKTQNGNNKIFVAFNTHGSEATPFEKHGICLSDGSYLPVDDPDLTAELKKISQIKNNQLSIMDLSCYSGSTVDHFSEVLGSKVCTLSAQSNNRPASFGKGLIDALKSNFAGNGEFSMADLYTDTLLTNIDQEYFDLHEPSISDSPNSNQIGNYSSRILNLDTEKPEFNSFCYEVDNILKSVELDKLTSSLQEIELKNLMSEYKSYKELLSVINRQTEKYNLLVSATMVDTCSSEIDKFYNEGLSLAIDMTDFKDLVSLFEDLSKKSAGDYGFTKNFLNPENTELNVEMKNIEFISDRRELEESSEFLTTAYLGALINEKIINKADEEKYKKRLRKLSRAIAKIKQKEIDKLSSRDWSALRKLQDKAYECEDLQSQNYDKLTKSMEELAPNISLKRYYDYRFKGGKSACKSFKF